LLAEQLDVYRSAALSWLGAIGSATRAVPRFGGEPCVVVDWQGFADYAKPA